MLIFGAGVLVMRSWRQCLVMSVVAGVVAGGVLAGPAIAARRTTSFGGAGGGPAAVARRVAERSVAFTADRARIGSGDLVQLGVQLVNLNSRKCLTVTAAGLADNAIVIQKDCTREAADRWRFVRASAAGLFLIENVNSGKCLSIVGGSLEDNGFAVQMACDNNPSGQWQVRRQGGSLPPPVLAARALLENGRSHRCLTIAGGSDAENGVAVQYACDAEASRRWEMRLVAGPALEGRYRPSA